MQSVKVALISVVASVLASGTLLFLMTPAEPAESFEFTSSLRRDLEEMHVALETARQELALLSAQVEMNAQPLLNAREDSLQPVRSPDEPQMSETEARIESEVVTLRLELEQLTRRIEVIEQALEPGRSLVDGLFARKPPAGENNGRPAWGVEQLLGPPDTPTPGDHATAWASGEPDLQDEWLLLTYGSAVKATAVEIHETFNPGAVYQISSVDASGREEILFEGIDPTATTEKSGVSIIPIAPQQRIHQIRIRIASANVAGWNEIDAVALIDRRKNRFWAVAAEASSSYSNRNSERIRFE